LYLIKPMASSIRTRTFTGFINGPPADAHKDGRERRGEIYH
jgi:hypothetical protein